MDSNNMQGGWNMGNYSGGVAEQKAPNIFQQFIYSFVPPRYDCLTKVKTGSMIGFVTLFMLVVTLVSFLDLVISYPSDFIEGLPDIVIRDGEMHIAEDVFYDTSYTYVNVTDEVDKFSYEDVRGLEKAGYRQILLVGREKISLLNDGKYQELYFDELVGSGELVLKDWYENTVEPILWICIVVGYVFFYIFRTLWYFLCAAIYLLIAMIAAQIFKKKRTAGDLFRVAVYSKVFMFVVVMARDLIPFIFIPIPLVIRVVLTIAFMCVAVWFMLRNNGNQAGMQQMW